MSELPNIIGLDLSLAATGVCDANGTYTIKTKPADQWERRLCFIREAIKDRLAIDQLDMLRGVDRPALCIVEDLPKMVKHGGTDLGGVHAAVRMMLFEQAIPFVLVPPGSLKKWATGNGNASKPTIRVEVFKRFGLDIADDNQADAFVLRNMALDAYGLPAVVMPQSHRECLEKIDWPRFGSDAS